MVSWNAKNIMYLAICIEYSLMILYLIYYLKLRLNPSKPLNYTSQVGFLGILLYLINISLFTLVIMECCKLAQDILLVISSCVYFSNFIILAGSW